MNVYFELIRYRNCAMAGLAAVIGAAIAYTATGAPPSSAVWMLPVFLTVFLATGAGNAINDYFDTSIDAINKPARPIPSGRISGVSAFRVSIALFATGIVVSYFVGDWQVPLLITVINTVLLYFYAKSLKRKVFVGNLSVAYLSGSTFLFGGSAYGMEGIKVTAVLFLLSMLATLAREIVKAIEDIEGDRKDGAVTLPVRIGERSSAYIASLVGILAVVLSPIPYLVGLFNVNYLIAVAVSDVFFLYAVYLILMVQEPAKSSKYFKVAMFFGLLAFIAGSFLK